MNEETMKAMLTYVQEGIEYADAEGNIMFINPSFTRITGITPQERIGKNIFDLNPYGVLANTLKTKKSYLGVRTTAPGRGGEGIANSSPIFEQGKLIGAVITILDITDFIQVSKNLSKSNSLLKGLIETSNTAKYSFKDIHSRDRKFLNTIKLAKKVARTNSTVLIEGESGTGKELFAHAIHAESERATQPLITINCASIPEGLLESEFFGHEQGAFTGASKKKIGVFELANHGTLFLDEIGEMALSLQAKLLRAIQEKEFRPVGSVKTKKVDVRLIAATNRNLKQMVQEGLFREDLYYRLSVVTIPLTPLRERIHDLVSLLPHLIPKINKKLGTNVTSIAPEAIYYLEQHHWPGNIRELENVLEYAILTTDKYEIRPEDILPKLPLKHAEELHFPSLHSTYQTGRQLTIQEMEKERILDALQRHGSDGKGKKRAAQELNISLATLYNKLKKYKLS